MFQNLKPVAGWTPNQIFYPTEQTTAYLNASGDAFDAADQLKKLQSQCYDSYPDGLIKGYHKGRAKAFNKCMDGANTTINNMIKENTKLQSDTQFSSAVESALGSSTSASTGSDSTSMIIGVFVLLLLAGGGYYWWTSRKPAGVPVGAPAAVAPTV